VSGMKDVFVKIPMSDIFLDESIYPRETIDHKRIAIFEENIRDGFAFDPIEVQVWPDPDNPAKVRYRILDGRHRWGAYKKTGATFIDVVIITLDQMEPILYAAKRPSDPSVTSTGDSPGPNCQKAGVAPADHITAFTQNVRIYQMGKCRFIEGFYRPASGAKARLA
jgi:hypothetical protein